MRAVFTFCLVLAAGCAVVVADNMHPGGDWAQGQTIEITLNTDGTPNMDGLRGAAAARESVPGVFAEVQPPIEVVSVWGCPDDVAGSARSSTSGCAEGHTITVRGRFFGHHGARVTLVAATKSLPTASSGLTIECPMPRHSAMLPSLLVYCTLPPRPALPDKQSVFHVRVIARNGISAIKRHAVSYAVDEENPAAGASAAQSKKTDSKLKLLDATRWAELGVGGLGPQFKELFRRAFGSRLGIVGPIVEKTGLRHVKGVIFHGLPGTGKTLVARKVAEALGAKQVRVVNGPEIMSKFVGDSERNLRELFTDAEAAWELDGVRAPLYVIIIDEIDSIMRARGSANRDDSAARAVYDGVTTQMLAYMDGVKSADNLLVIGLTNRLDALDPALLRPGRFEVQIRFPLPDRDGRKQILDIHTATLVKNNFLAKDVNMEALVDATSAFSGADLAAIVRSATSFAMQRIYENAPADGDALSDRDVSVQFTVTQADLKRGMREVLAGKGSGASTEPFLTHGFVTYHERVSASLQRLQRFADDVKNGGSQTVMRILIEGPPESGLTATAAAVARLTKFPHVHIISADALIGLGTDEKVERLRQAFDAAVQAPAACLILDSLEHLLEYNDVQGRINAGMQQELAALIRRRTAKSARQISSGSNKDDEKDGRLLIIATSSVGSAVRVLGGGVALFDAVEVLQPLTRADAAVVLTAYGVKSTDSGRSSANEVRAFAALLPPALPVKRLVYWINLAHARASQGKAGPVRPVGDKKVTLDVFADAADDVNTAAKSDGKVGAAGSEAPEGPTVPLETLTDVLQELGVLEKVDLADSLAEVVQW
jgi:SpoVK/Ycf46/Vps4 family AAA+-type ATPase